jgi:AraC-like DNA-binding protein
MRNILVVARIFIVQGTFCVRGMGMRQPSVFWVTDADKKGVPSVAEGLARHCRVHYCREVERLAEELAERHPDIICFDFDQLGRAQRALVQHIRLYRPSIPALLFTSSRSPELLIWALRTRVWDCFIKPVSCGEVQRRFNMLLPVLDGRGGQRSRKLLMPEREPVAQVSGEGPKSAGARTTAVLPYLQEHFHERIVLPDVARLCRLSSFEFSRLFRREQGVTFRDYLLRLRIDAAARRLRKEKVSVLNVAASVGFNDPSHFARVFRRHMGVTPRRYRDGARPGAYPTA